MNHKMYCTNCSAFYESAERKIEESAALDISVLADGMRVGEGRKDGIRT